MAVVGVASAVAVGTALVLAVASGGRTGVTVESVSDRNGIAGSEHDGGIKEPTAEDVEFLDDYAEELGLVMIRSRGPEPEAFARMVDGPGPDVESLRLSGSAYEDGAEVVLRLRRDREQCGWMAGSSCESYEISACYRWLLGASVDDHRPERLDACPDEPVIELGPPPIEPRLPDGLDERMTTALAGLAEISAEAVRAAVYAAYRDAVEAELRRSGVEPGHLLSADDAIDDDSVATDGNAVGVAVGAGRQCVMIRVSPGEVSVWRPDSTSLEPGEVGCSAAAAAFTG